MGSTGLWYYRGLVSRFDLRVYCASKIPLVVPGQSPRGPLLIVIYALQPLIVCNIARPGLISS